MEGIQRTVSRRVPEATHIVHGTLPQRRQRITIISIIKSRPQFLTHKKTGIPIKQYLYFKSADEKK